MQLNYLFFSIAPHHGNKIYLSLVYQISQRKLSKIFLEQLNNLIKSLYLTFITPKTIFSQILKMDRKTILDRQRYINELQKGIK